MLRASELGWADLSAVALFKRLHVAQWVVEGKGGVLPESARPVLDVENWVRTVEDMMEMVRHALQVPHT